MAVLPGADLTTRCERDETDRYPGWDWVRRVVPGRRIFLDIELPSFEITGYKVRDYNTITEVTVPRTTSTQAMRVLAAVLDCEVVRGGDV